MTPRNARCSSPTRREDCRPSPARGLSTSRLRVPRIALLLLLLTVFTVFADYVERASVDVARAVIRAT